MEAKLAEYRAKKRSHLLSMEISTKVESCTKVESPKIAESTAKQCNVNKLSPEASCNQQAPLLQEYKITKPLDSVSRKLWFLQWLLKIAIWLVMYAVFVKLEFGAVYFAISVIVFLVSTLRASRQRRPNELSAYSVFNPNFEVLDGTFTAEQFDSQIRNGGILR